jgi:hypothetical protein
MLSFRASFRGGIMAAKPNKEPVSLSLDEIVRDIAEQLHSLRENPPKDPVIAFTGCEIELSVKASAEADGGIRFYIFSAGAKAASEVASKVKLSFGAAGVPVVLQAETPGVDLKHKRQP